MEPGLIPRNRPRGPTLGLRWTRRSRAVCIREVTGAAPVSSDVGGSTSLMKKTTPLFSVGRLGYPEWRKGALVLWMTCCWG
jgi:hypothetical protein